MVIKSDEDLYLPPDTRGKDLLEQLSGELATPGDKNPKKYPNVEGMDGDTFLQSAYFNTAKQAMDAHNDRRDSEIKRLRRKNHLKNEWTR